MSALPTAAYVDSSALVKLAIPEPESMALRAELVRWQRHVSSALARVEVLRACTRVDERSSVVATQVIDALDLITIDEELLHHAARIAPAALRSLDAIHVASAVLVGDALGVVVAYDERLLDAMAAAGFPTVSPH